MIIAITMIMVSLVALNKPNLLYIDSTQSARTLKGNPFSCFQFEDFKDFSCLNSNGTKSQILGPRMDSDLAP